MGWAWQPGGFYGWNAAPVVVDPPAGYKAPAPPASTAANHPTMAINPRTRTPVPLDAALRQGLLGAHTEAEGGRPGRMMTSVPVHGGALQRSVNRGTMGPHGTMLSPRGRIARSPAVSAPRMGGERMGGYGGFGRVERAPAPRSSTPAPAPAPAPPHH
jgi:hypothetical protein